MEPGSSAPWLSFQHWLAQHRGVSHERVESSSDSDSAFGDPVALSELPVGHPGQGMSLGRMPEIMPRPGVPDCRLETRLVNEYTCARQQMTVMLAAPGLPAHKAPVVTAKQVRHGTRMREDGGTAGRHAGWWVRRATTRTGGRG